MRFRSTKEGADSSRRTSSDAQLREVRIRARRRLVGAALLVLTAVIVVPLLLSSEPEDGIADVPFNLAQEIPTIVAPSLASKAEENSGASNTLLNEFEGEDVIENEQNTLIEDELLVEPIPDAIEHEPITPDPKPEPKPEPKPKPKPEPKPAPTPRPTERTDDGSVALAILGGQVPDSAPTKPAVPAQNQNFIVQVAALAGEAEANGIRDRLISSGITNAFVARSVVNGKNTYRVRIGTFSSREAAVAAQTRLRSLFSEYKDSFITKP